MEASSVSMNSLVNLSNLEKVFSQVFSRLSSLENRADKSESEMSQKVSLSRFLSMQHEYESNITLLESRIQQLEQTITALKPTTERCHTNAVNIDKIRESQKKLVSIIDFEAQLNELESDTKSSFDKLSNMKANNTRVKKLEESQHNICSQIAALESMLQCKVDRSHMPLIESCQKQLNNIESTQDQLTDKLCVVDDQLLDIFNQLTEKTDKSHFEQFNSDLETTLLGKVDNSQLDTAIDTFSTQLNIDAIRQTQSKCGILLEQTQDKLQKVAFETEEHTNRLDKVSKQLFSVASVTQLQKKCDRAYAEQLTEECMAFCRNNNSVLEKTNTEMSTQLINLKSISNTLSEQMAVVLRFVDWYSSVNLEK